MKRQEIKKQKITPPRCQYCGRFMKAALHEKYCQACSQERRKIASTHFKSRKLTKADLKGGYILPERD